MTSSGTVLAWIASQIPLLTSTVAAICGNGLQADVWSYLREHGPITVHELAENMGHDHDRVRNALYRLICIRAVRCIHRIPSPIGASRPRVVWAAVDRDGVIYDGKQRAEW